MDEIWKVIDGTNNEYEISSFGNIRKATDHGFILINPHKDRCGYLRIKLKPMKSSVAVHRLVASAFIPNPYNYPVVHHIDENKSNNSVNNLLWCSHRHNRLFARSENKSYSRKTVIQRDSSGNIVGSYATFTDAARALGNKDSSTIRKCALGLSKLKTAYGYSWSVQYNGSDEDSQYFYQLASKAYSLAPKTAIRSLEKIVMHFQGK